MKIKIKKIVPQARIPVYHHQGDAGMDLFSSVDMTINPGETAAVPTGIQMAIPPGFVGLIWDKSGIALGGVHRLAGVVDAGYRGEVRVVLINLGRQPFIITTGMKIAQMLIQPVESPEVIEVEELDQTSRGEGGFGSTGLY
ncbi:MAG: dUTP diphosphatase [Candidatus Aminicenantes bacterium]|jgi:deoxyuridine 5'-triphosphate nucleotidohydrolase (EC 3.6.1.23)|nr:dUTP diphosphatase [Candidatus Aminicenantes bacterium]